AAGGGARGVGADQVADDVVGLGDAGAAERDAVAVVAGDDVVGDGGAGPALDVDALLEVGGGGTVLVQADRVALDQGTGPRAGQIDAGEGVEADQVAGAGRGSADRGVDRVLDDDAVEVRQRPRAVLVESDDVALDERAAGFVFHQHAIGAGGVIAGDHV